MRKKLGAFILVVVMLLSFAVPSGAAEVNNFNIVNLASIHAEQYYKFGITSVQLKNKALDYMLSTGDTNIDNVLEAMFKGLDDYSEYFTKEEYEEFMESVNATLCGIGASVVKGRDGSVILDVVPFSPAEKAGLKPFDVIVSVDGVDVSKMAVTEATKYTRGVAGTTVKIGIKRIGEDDIRFFDIVRAYVETNPVTWKKLDDETAYISLSILSVNADFFMKEALKEIDKLGIKKIILDLRDNPGGHLGATVNICEMFMPEGPVGYVDFKDPSKMETYYSKNKNPEYKLAVLINGNTASGAEFLSGGLQDTKVGVLFGETSFGKGTVQYTTQLETGGAIKLTVAKYYTAGKQDVANDKINPDFEVKNAYRQIKEEAFSPLDFETEFKVGSKGKGVLAIEERLVVLGYMDEADEEFTEETMTAVRTLKASNGMGIEECVEFDFIAFLNNVEYDKMYEEVDRQFESAYKYLKELK